MATSNSSSANQDQIVSASDYIQNLGNRVNEVSTTLQQNQAKEANLGDEQQILQDQLDRVAKILVYVKKVDPQIHELWESVKGLLHFFEVKSPSHLSQAQQDLKPAEDTLKAVTTMITEIGSRLYFAIVNTNVCATAVEETYLKLIKNTKHDPDPDSPPNQFGKVSVDIPPQDDLVKKLKNASDAGVAAMEKLANTFLEYINYLQSVEELNGLATYLTLGFKEEIKALDQLDDRIENRERIAHGEQREYEKDYKQVNKEYERVAAYILQLEQDYNLLRAEFDAAMNSVKTGTPVPVVS